MTEVCFQCFFFLYFAQHHCHHCGKVFCEQCTSKSVLGISSNRMHPVCENCYAVLSKDSKSTFYNTTLADDKSWWIVEKWIRVSIVWMAERNSTQFIRARHVLPLISNLMKPYLCMYSGEEYTLRRLSVCLQLQTSKAVRESGWPSIHYCPKCVGYASLFDVWRDIILWLAKVVQQNRNAGMQMTTVVI